MLSLYATPRNRRGFAPTACLHSVRYGFRPTLEVLEDRSVPVVLKVVETGGIGLAADIPNVVSAVRPAALVRDTTNPTAPVASWSTSLQGEGSNPPMRTFEEWKQFSQKSVFVNYSAGILFQEVESDYEDRNTPRKEYAGVVIDARYRLGVFKGPYFLEAGQTNGTISLGTQSEAGAGSPGSPLTVRVERSKAYEREGNPVRLRFRARGHIEGSPSASVVYDLAYRTPTEAGKLQPFGKDKDEVTIDAVIGDTFEVSLALSTTGTQQGIGSEASLTLAVHVEEVPLPDLRPTILQWSEHVPFVEFAHENGSVDASTPPVATFYWANGPSLDARQGGPALQLTLDRQAGAHTSLAIAESDLAPPPDDATHLVVVLDEAEANATRGRILERNEDNNVLVLARPSLTIITHGFQPPGSEAIPDWTGTLINRLRDAGVDNIVEVDWASESGRAAPGWAEATGDRLFARIMAALLAGVRPTSLHFISHSRGAVVNSETNRRLAHALQTVPGLASKLGFVQTTMLDPHPANNHAGASGSPSLVALDRWFEARVNDPDPALWGHETFADVYYQRNGANSLNLWGMPIPGAYNRNLDGQQRINGEDVMHTTIHGWYTDTVEANSADRGGFYHSFHGLGWAERPPFTAIPLSFAAPTPLLNGDFRFNALFFDEIPGWEAENIQTTKLQTLRLGRGWLMHQPSFLTPEWNRLSFDVFNETSSHESGTLRAYFVPAIPDWNGDLVANVRARKLLGSWSLSGRGSPREPVLRRGQWQRLFVDWPLPTHEWGSVGSVRFEVSGKGTPTVLLDNVTLDGTRTASPSVLLGPLPSETVYGESITLTATVRSATAQGGLPTGSVVFRVDGVDQPAVLLSGGAASLTLPRLGTGPHSVSAWYRGNGVFLPGGSAVALLIVRRIATQTVLTVSANPALWDQPLRLTAQVTASTPGAGIPTGTVVFRSGEQVIGAATVNAKGQAILTVRTALLPGRHVLTAHFWEDSTFLSSLSPPFVLIVKEVWPV